MDDVLKRINYNSAAELKAFLDEHNLGMRKRYGQNFLINPAIRQTLVDTLQSNISTNDIWEIGPGLGAMTVLLLEKGLRVKAFEIDTGFIEVLKKLFSGNRNFTLIEGDALKTCFAQQDTHHAPYLLGNLPYNIAATLIAGFIEKGYFFKRIVVTVQREVASRMTAAVGSANYSSFSVLCASAYHVKPLMIIKSGSFYPQPNVDSAAVVMELREDTASRVFPPCFYPLIRGLFSSRRKTIKNNLCSFLPANGQSAASVPEILRKSGLDGNKRAETLTVDDFAALAYYI